MTNTELLAKIKAEIERQREFIEGMFIEGDNNFYDGQDDAYNNILSFLSTLEGPSSDDLEEAAETKYPERWKKYPNDGIVRSEEYFDLNTEKRDAFIAGAKWQEKQDDKELSEKIASAYQLGLADKEKKMLKEAEETELYWDVDFLAIDLNMAALGYSERDKVRIIVLKKEDEK